MDVQMLEGLTLLVVDDDSLLRKRIIAHLERCGADITGVGTTEETRRIVGVGGMDFDFALLDINLPDGSGLDLLRQRVFPPGMGVIVMTAEAGVALAVEAMRSGAADYLVKPFELDELPLVIERACRSRQRARLEEHQRKGTEDYAGFFFGESLAELERLLKKVIETDTRVRSHLSPVLIQGETGTGKTTIARWLHHRGPRAARPLVEMNCSALPEALAESELFGHERGAFTDAHATRIGLFEASQGGTLFLDELPSLAMPLQAKLLKAIEDQRIRRVGGRKEVPIDVRIIAATSVDLNTLVAAGQFREDLLHRLDLFRVIMPPLRDRSADLVELAEQLLGRLAERHRLPAKRLSKVGQQRLRLHPWPGNVRELTNELERAMVFEEGDLLDLHQLRVTDGAKGEAGLPTEDWLKPGFIFPKQGFQLEGAITTFINRALKQADGNVSGAARLLGVTRDYVRYRLAEQKAQEPNGETPPASETA